MKWYRNVAVSSFQATRLQFSTCWLIERLLLWKNVHIYKLCLNDQLLFLFIPRTSWKRVYAYRFSLKWWYWITFCCFSTILSSYYLEFIDFILIKYEIFHLIVLSFVIFIRICILRLSPSHKCEIVLDFYLFCLHVQ